MLCACLLSSEVKQNERTREKKTKFGRDQAKNVEHNLLKHMVSGQHFWMATIAAAPNPYQ